MKGVLNLAFKHNQFNLCAMWMSVLYDLVKWFASLRNLTVLQIGKWIVWIWQPMPLSGVLNCIDVNIYISIYIHTHCYS